jgi:hypothetical protein
MRIDPKVKKTLNDTGLPWEVETGSKHFKVRLQGRLVGIFPHGKRTDGSQHANANLLANIKRLARELTTQ